MMKMIVMENQLLKTLKKTVLMIIMDSNIIFFLIPIVICKILAQRL